MTSKLFLYTRCLMAAVSALLLSSLSVSSQTPQQPGQAPSSGVAGGLGAAAVYDSEHRPITAGGFVDSGPVVFQDVTKAAGLSGWVHKMGAPEKNFILETNGSGVALLDYDNDGWLDIYLVNGATFDSLDGKETPPHAALFHNNHDGTFTDVAAKAGVTNDRWGYGVSVADFDNDGWPDLYVGNYGKNRLYRNNHDGTFTSLFEEMLVRSGIHLIKYWFSVSDGEQERRFVERMHNPFKRWKLSPMDLEARKHWVEYSKAKDRMLEYTDRKKTPWYIVDADNKKRARLNCIRHLLHQIPYKDLRPIELELPPRQPDNGYKRPKKSKQNWVRATY